MRDGGGRHNVVRPGPWLLPVGQVQKITGRDYTMLSVLGQVENTASALDPISKMLYRSLFFLKVAISQAAFVLSQGHHGGILVWQTWR